MPLLSFLFVKVYKNAESTFLAYPDLLRPDGQVVLVQCHSPHSLQCFGGQQFNRFARSKGNMELGRAEKCRRVGQWCLRVVIEPHPCMLHRVQLLPDPSSRSAKVMARISSVCASPTLQRLSVRSVRSSDKDTQLPRWLADNVIQR